MKSNPQTETRWDKVREGFRRDWEQTRNDFGSDRARDLDQDVSDTMRQAFGNEPIPKDATFERYEPAFRYGHEARSRYNEDWTPAIGNRLERDYQGDWQTDRSYVKYGYLYGQGNRGQAEAMRGQGQSRPRS
ncbi:MAG: hypothetical protein AB7S38_19200 [Vulcanimicrobiota bacterium]